MTNHSWFCRICNEAQSTVERPNVPVCVKCVKPVAAYLCKEELGVELGMRGINQPYWMDQASFLIALMIKRWKPIQERDLQELMGRPEVLFTGETYDRTR